MKFIYNLVDRMFMNDLIMSFNYRPLVTIMIPTYNQSDFISKAVESALDQNYSNIEVIVSDDNSTDETALKLEKYNENPRFYYSKNLKNIGRVENYRKLLYELANGEWVINLDGDDYYTSNTFISDAIANINMQKKNKLNVVAYCFNYPLLELANTLSLITKRDETSIISGRDYFLNYWKIGDFTHMNTLYNRNLAKSVDCFTKKYQASDFESLMKVFLNGEIILDSKAIGIRRIHGTNTTINEISTQYNDILRTYGDILEYAKLFFLPDVLETWYNRMKKRAKKENIIANVKYNKSVETFCMLIKNMRFSKQYLSLWYMYLFVYK